MLERARLAAVLVTSPTGLFWIGNCSARGGAACCNATTLWGGTEQVCIDDGDTEWVAVTVSLCPDTATMQSEVNGHCGACHTSGQQVHLP